jgi:ketol-acid reductoisomerase
MKKPLCKHCWNLARQKTLEEIIDDIDDDEMAEQFHKEYEKASKAYGWNTQKESQVDYWRLPESNRQAMVGTIIQMKLWLKSKLELKQE